ncbi:hypothetical protein MMC30_003577 [Trapelia coarctata]|nr:hypothetical protein [Trapelia coarctata]
MKRAMARIAALIAEAAARQLEAQQRAIAAAATGPPPAPRAAATMIPPRRSATMLTSRYNRVTKRGRDEAEAARMGFDLPKRARHDDQDSEDGDESEDDDEDSDGDEDDEHGGAEDGEVMEAADEVVAKRNTAGR